MLWLITEDEEDHESGSVLMDEEIWSALPQEILFAVLGCLSFDSFFRFRAVCKQWNALLRNPSSSPFFSSPPAFYNKPCTIFKTNEATTRLCSFVQPEILEMHLSTNQRRRRDHMRLSWRHLELDFLHPLDRLVSSHGGLLLISRRHNQYLVCNPLLRAWTELPPLPIMSIYSDLIAIFRMNPTSTSFKVIWWGQWSPILGSERGLIPSYLYDSSLRAWKPIARRPFVSSILFHQENGTLCKNIYYNWSILSLDLLAFDFERETWHIFETKRVPESNLPFHFAVWEWQDHLMMIAQDNRSMSIWMLSEDNRWNQFDILTQDTQDAIADGMLLFHCICMGNILLFLNCTRSKVLAYNFVSKALMISNNSSIFFPSFVSFNPILQLPFS